MEETNIINLVKSIPSKEGKSKENKKKNFFRIFKNKYIYIPSVFILIVISQCIIQCIFKDNNSKKNQRYDINFKYEDFDKEIITDKIKTLSGWIMGEDQARFINGIFFNKKGN